MEKVLLVDYENVQNIDFSLISEPDFRIYVFIGDSQNRIPFDLVKSAQKLGDRLEWIKIDGQGSNALDFHVAYYLGSQIQKNPDNEYIILSKDKGFDPLLRFITKQNIKCKRINSIIEISKFQVGKEPNKEYLKVLENLKKIEKVKRPRRRNTLKQHVKSLLGKTLPEETIDEIIDQLFISKIVSEEKGKVIYEL